MNLSYKEEQIDFFNGQDSAEPSSAGGTRLWAARLALSVENLVVLAIVGIMVMLFSFSLGVERGKFMARTSSEGLAVSSSVGGDRAEAVKVPEVPVREDRPVRGETPAAAAVAPRESVASARAAQGGYTIQVASYKTDKSAQIEADNLKKRGFAETHILTKGAYKVLCVGSFKSKAEAQQFGQKLKSRYHDLTVRSL